MAASPPPLFNLLLLAQGDLPPHPPKWGGNGERLRPLPLLKVTCKICSASELPAQLLLWPSPTSFSSLPQVLTPSTLPSNLACCSSPLSLPRSSTAPAPLYSPTEPFSQRLLVITHQAQQQGQRWSVRLRVQQLILATISQRSLKEIAPPSTILPTPAFLQHILPTPAFLPASSLAPMEDALHPVPSH